MMQAKLITPSRATWPIGLRVSRKNTRELGTVVGRNGKIKVKWKGGKTTERRQIGPIGPALHGGGSPRAPAIGQTL